MWFMFQLAAEHALIELHRLTGIPGEHEGKESDAMPIGRSDVGNKHVSPVPTPRCDNANVTR